MFVVNRRVLLAFSCLAVVGLLFPAIQAKFCYTDSACGFGKYCCGQRSSLEPGTCEDDCLGDECGDNSNCGSGECCNSDNVCAYDCYSGLAGGIIAAIVIGVIIVIAIPVGIVACCCCCGAAAASASRRPVQGVVISQQPQAAPGVTVVNTNTSNMQTQQYPATGPGPAYYNYSQPAQAVPAQSHVQAPPPYKA